MEAIRDMCLNHAPEVLLSLFEKAEGILYRCAQFYILYLERSGIMEVKWPSLQWMQWLRRTWQKDMFQVATILSSCGQSTAQET